MFAELVDASEAGLIHGERLLGILTEAPAKQGVGGSLGGHQLEHHRPPDLPVAGLVGDAVEALTEPPDELVSSDRFHRLGSCFSLAREVRERALELRPAFPGSNHARATLSTLYATTPLFRIESLKLLQKPRWVQQPQARPQSAKPRALRRVGAVKREDAFLPSHEEASLCGDGKVEKMVIFGMVRKRECCARNGFEPRSPEHRFTKYRGDSRVGERWGSGSDVGASKQA